jgi:hypothetical protein
MLKKKSCFFLFYRLSRFILIYGLANLLLSPFIFIWQVLNLFYGYTEVKINK